MENKAQAIIIVCEHKAKKCEDCMFYSEQFIATGEENVVNLVTDCMFGVNYENCPCYEANTTMMSIIEDAYNNEKAYNNEDATMIGRKGNMNGK